MKAGLITVTVLAAAVLMGSGVWAGAWADTASADDESLDQKIYLDPQTGAVLETPDARGDEHADPVRSSAGRAERRSVRDAPQAWTNDQGDEMLTPAPDDAPAVQAVRCDDGTLRMGHAERAPGEGERHALCAGAAQ